MYTLLHVLISFVGLATGSGVLAELIEGRQSRNLTAWFLATTILTNGTGFGFPFFALLPSHIVAIISLVVLAVAAYALYGAGLAGPWRRIYVVLAVLALYLNVFVLITQMFRRVPAMIALAPTQSEPPFAVTQGLVFLVFAWLGVRAVKGFTSA